MADNCNTFSSVQFMNEKLMKSLLKRSFASTYFSPRYRCTSANYKTVYASPARRGFTHLSDNDRLEAFVRC